MPDVEHRVPDVLPASPKRSPAATDEAGASYQERERGGLRRTRGPRAIEWLDALGAGSACFSVRAGPSRRKASFFENFRRFAVAFYSMSHARGLSLETVFGCDLLP